MLNKKHIYLLYAVIILNCYNQIDKLKKGLTIIKYGIQKFYLLTSSIKLTYQDY